MSRIANFLPALLLLLLGVITPLAHLVAQVSADFTSQADLIAMPWIRQAALFTVWQASLSSLLSVGLAIPLALLLANRSWPFRRLILTLSALPFALPSVLVAFAFVLAYGRSGFVGALLGHRFQLLYNPYAVVAAHIFFNLPFALRVILDALESLPQELIRSAQVLNLTGLLYWRVVVWPHLKNTVVTLLLLVAILCLSSFAVVLILGGGPQVTTLEVAVYQLLRFEANPTSASLVALGQLLLLVPVVWLYRRVSSNRVGRSSLGTGISVAKSGAELSLGGRISGMLALFVYALFLLLPLAGLSLDATRGFIASASFLLHSEVFEAIAGSIALAAPSALLCVMASWMFARGVVATEMRWPRLSSAAGDAIWLLMGVSPTVLTLAWIVTLSAHDFDPFGNPYPSLLFVHTLLALPLCIRTLLPHAQEVHKRVDRSACSLGIEGMARMRFIEWPEMRRPLLSALMLAFAFSLGDVSCVLMFGSGQFSTLPLYIFELMGAYRFGAAAIASVVLAAVCIGFFWLSETRLRSREEAS